MMDNRADTSSALACLGEGKAFLLYTELVADLETPVSVMLKLGADKPYNCLLESVEGGRVRGRFSVIALDPDLIWRVNGDTITTTDINGRILARETGDALEALRRLIRQSRMDIPKHLPPMSSGLFGFFGYEMIRYMERIPTDNRDDLGTPDACLMRPSAVVIIDRLKDSLLVATPVRPDDAGGDHRKALAAGQQKLDDIANRLNAPLRHAPTKKSRQKPPQPTSNVKKPDFLNAVRKAIEYIKSGDIFQVVLSQRFSVPFTKTPFALYRALRRLNPSPFLIYFHMGDFALVGSSPEILVRLRDEKVTIRPIAGTRPRGKTPAEDQQLAAELLADPKERAEHLMLLDLGRNDAGRVSRPGSVEVVDQFAIERYSHVMHIASEVQGTIRPEYDAIDALKAGFPAGTVSGAPKIRAMEIIHELESVRRGPYAGAAGYISADGDMDTCIILRTAVVKDGMMHIQAGAGIVYDSVPEKEFDETLAKAMALIRATEVALDIPDDAPPE